MANLQPTVDQAKELKLRPFYPLSRSRRGHAYLRRAREENADLMISLNDSPINFVLCWHEQAAAFIADVYSLTSVAGRLPFIHARVSALTNLVTGFSRCEYGP
jgi:hypothetical protein